ncbi:hypothetical protein H6G33_00680 [Calothrix sp. FACHB-1219]|uniref:hypothetical protein n=1 Tax=Calothrix sp. FACHB-1219 TaxID=2692778 RepID=UPI0019A37F9D|nr:hypothetical protein [Calothrix sp. FACHB-1219]MBD2215550.1 hypothetical protein [Calothrix sp. FACHB-1219]
MTLAISKELQFLAVEGFRFKLIGMGMALAVAGFKCRIYLVFTMRQQQKGKLAQLIPQFK